MVSMRYRALQDFFNQYGSTLKWLSKKTGINYRTLWGILYREQNPSEEQLKSICEATGISEEDMLNSEIILFERVD